VVRLARRVEGGAGRQHEPHLAPVRLADGRRVLFHPDLRSRTVGLGFYVLVLTGLLVVWIGYAYPEIVSSPSSRRDPQLPIALNVAFVAAVSPFANGMIRAILYLSGRGAADLLHIPVVGLVVGVLLGLAVSSKRAEHRPIGKFVLSAAIVIIVLFFLVDLVVALLFLLRLTSRQSVLGDNSPGHSGRRCGPCSAQVRGARPFDCAPAIGRLARPTRRP
jgi:hypothetical protein